MATNNKSAMEKLTTIFGTMLESKLKEVKDINVAGQQELILYIEKLNNRLDNIEKVISDNHQSVKTSKNAEIKSNKNLQMAVDLLLLRIDELETKVNAAPKQNPNVRFNDAGPAPNMFKQEDDIIIEFD